MYKGGQRKPGTTFVLEHEEESVRVDGGILRRGTGKFLRKLFNRIAESLNCYLYITDTAATKNIARLPRRSFIFSPLISFVRRVQRG